jgi:hypothetical protein
MTIQEEFSTKPLDGFLADLVTGTPLQLDDLTVVPVFSEKAHAPAYLDLEAALRGGLVTVAEVSDAGAVPELIVANAADRDLLILDGEELIGAKQNRTVNVTLIVAACSKVTIPVACVERGRWRYQTDRFAAGDAHLYPSLRASRTASVTENLRAYNSRAANQGSIWSDIAAKSLRMGVESNTEAMRDIFKEKLDGAGRLESAFAWQENQCGIVVFIRGGFAGADLFGTSQFCACKLPKLVRGFYLDSLDSALRFPRLGVPEILAGARNARHEPFGSAGKGLEVRFQGKQVHGAWTLDGDSIPHVALFPRARPASRRRQPDVIH